MLWRARQAASPALPVCTAACVQGEKHSAGSERSRQVPLAARRGSTIERTHPSASGASREGGEAGVRSPGRADVRRPDHQEVRIDYKDSPAARMIRAGQADLAVLGG